MEDSKCIDKKEDTKSIEINKKNGSKIDQSN
jgi:hypothetical protein